MKTLLLVASAAIYCTCTYYDDSEEIYYRHLRQRRNEELNLNESFFPQLLNYRVEGDVVTQTEYPWVASVFHSTTKSVPYLCTAVCIKSNIFISAARCVYTLKVIFTSIIYQQQRLKVKALVVPSKSSKQLYDDIGFIITKDELSGKWNTIDIYDQKRTDDVFQWFQDIKFDNFEHKVIGFAFPKVLQNIPVWHRSVDLVELDVAVGINLCSKILSYNNLIEGFPVPCYHSCNLSMFQDGHSLCQKYHGVEGGALVNKKTNKLFGLATWGAHYIGYELPVGFSVPNSESFYEDFECAMKIRNNKATVTDGFYQKLCDSKRKSEIY